MTECECVRARTRKSVFSSWMFLVPKWLTLVIISVNVLPFTDQCMPIYILLQVCELDIIFNFEKVQFPVQ